MSIDWFDSLSILTVYICTVVFILLSFEFGYQIGKYSRSHYEKTSDTAQGPMIGGVLALLAFVLALTFSMAASKYDFRKQNVLEEVNAINTAYLRADLIAQPHEAEVKRLLREYVDIRLRGIDKGEREAAITRSYELHNLLWEQASAVVKQDPSFLSGLLIQSINQIIDIHEKRFTAAIRDRIHISIWFTLYAITAFAMMTIGSQTGLVKTRRLIQVIPTVLAFSALVTLVVDLDRPADLGQIKVSQEAMIDLQNKMER